MINIIICAAAFLIQLFCLVHYAVPFLIESQGQKIFWWIYFGFILGFLLFDNGYLVIIAYKLWHNP